MEISKIENVRKKGNRFFEIVFKKNGILEDNKWKSSFLPEKDETRIIEGKKYKILAFPYEYKEKAEKIIGKKNSETNYFISEKFTYKFNSIKKDDKFDIYKKQYEIEMVIIGIDISNLFIDNKNWKLLAVKDTRDFTINFYEKDNNFGKILEKLETIKSENCFCEHCNTIRQRYKMAIISDGEKIKTVGLNCIEKYMNKGLFEAIEKLNVFMKENCPFCCELDEDGKIIRFAKNANKIFRAEYIIGLLLWLYKDFEYKYKSVSSCGYKNSTSNELCYMLGCNNHFVEKDGRKNEFVSSLDYSKININNIPEKYIQRAKIIANEMYNKFNNEGIKMNDFETKIYSSISKNENEFYISEKNFSFIGYFIETVCNSEKENNSNFIGKIGDKIEFQGKINSIKTIECYDFRGNLIERNIIGIIDEKGNNYSFFIDTSKTKNKVGDSVKVKGKIKEYKEYKGIKTNVLFYVKIS